MTTQQSSGELVNFVSLIWVASWTALLVLFVLIAFRSPPDDSHIIRFVWFFLKVKHFLDIFLCKWQCFIKDGISIIWEPP